MTVDYNSWLRDETNHRVILAEIEYHDGSGLKTLYISTSPYITEPTDTIYPNTPYAGIISELDNLESSIEDSATIGSLTIVNYSSDGEFNKEFEFDNILYYSFEGHQIKILLGDKSWDRGDFETIFIGRVDKLDMPNNLSITFNITDNSDILDKPIQQEEHNDFFGAITGLPQLENTPKPICLGTVFNISPILIDRTGYAETYQVHDGQIKSILEVRENGFPLVPGEGNDYVVDIATGTFLLNNKSTGLITADVEGGYDYLPNFGKPIDIVKWIAKEVGFTNADFYNEYEPGGFDYFHTNICSYNSGLYITNIQTAEETITRFLDNIGSYIYFNPLGLMCIYRLEAPTEDPALIKGQISEDDIVKDSLALVETQVPNKLTRIGYKYNYTIQTADSLAAILNTEEKARYGQEYIVVKSENTDPNILDKYPLAIDTEDIITNLYYSTCAQNEAIRRQLIRNIKRFTYKLTVYNPNCPLILGSTIKIKHPRFGMKLGKSCVILSKNMDIINRTTELEVFF